MDPIPETAEAIAEFGPFIEQDGDLLDHLADMERRVREVVPECIGFSLASRELGVTFTLVATEETISALDGVQYLDGGPCVEAVANDHVIEFSGDALDEEKWQMFARATAAAGVACTLTLPLLADGEVQGSVNLYAAMPDAFAGKHQRLADAVGGWAPGAVANADLSFLTRRTAETAPQILHDEMRVEVAIGILMGSLDVTVDAARARLVDAAAKAGVSVTSLAEAVIETATTESAEESSEGPSDEGRGGRSA